MKTYRYLPTFESAVGGDEPPNWIALGGRSARRPFPLTFVLFLKTILKHLCLIHIILNERKTNHLYHDFYSYKSKEIYMYWVLSVVLLDLWQGLVVLKSSLFSIIWQFVGHGGWTFLFRGSCRGWLLSVGGVTLKWGWVGNDVESGRGQWLQTGQNIWIWPTCTDCYNSIQLF